MIVSVFNLLQILHIFQVFCWETCKDGWVSCIPLLFMHQPKIPVCVDSAQNHILDSHYVDAQSHTHDTYAWSWCHPLPSSVLMCLGITHSQHASRKLLKLRSICIHHICSISYAITWGTFLKSPLNSHPNTTQLQRFMSLDLTQWGHHTSLYQYAFTQSFKLIRVISTRLCVRLYTIHIKLMRGYGASREMNMCL